MEIRPRIETLKGETLKTAAELALNSLAKLRFNEAAFRLVRGGERIEDDRLCTSVAGLDFENPLIVGAGWDKKGWAVDGLYKLGFAGTEVGSVLVHPQKGNPKPRLFYQDGAGLNRMGFNSLGQEAVASYLARQKRLGIIGISLGKNKLTPDAHAPWAHAAVADRLHEFANYFVINVASPNTPGLRELLRVEPLTDIVQAVKEVLVKKGQRPLFIKTTVDLALEDLNQVLELCASEELGIIDSNTTVDLELKRRHGWAGEAGGLSGAEPLFRHKVTERMKHITRETRGTSVSRIGVGAVNDVDSALERIKAGAQIVQVVTGIRQHKGKVANAINRGLLKQMESDGVNSIEEYVGASVNTY